LVNENEFASDVNCAKRPAIRLRSLEPSGAAKRGKEFRSFTPSPRHLVTPASLLTLTILTLATGCVERSLTITSSPPGALVYLNEEEIGHSPVKRPFLWYGNYDVTLRQDGYETLKTTQDVKPPLFQIVPFDLFAEILPFQYKDDQTFNFVMKPLAEPETRPLIDRAVEMRGKLEGPENATTKPGK
jgi:hypothetical protein